MLNSTSASNHEVPTEYKQPYYIAIQGILGIVTLVGNGLVVFLILTRRSLKVNTNYFILSLAVADFLVGLCLPTFSIVCSLWLTCHWEIFYKFFNLFTTASVANLVVMTGDRCMAINYPLWYSRKMTSKRVMISIATAWIISAVLSMIPFIWIYSSDEALREGLSEVHYYVLLLLFELLPVVTMPIVYVRIVWVVRKHSRQVTQQREQLSYNHHITGLERPSRERERSSTTVLGLVIFLFVVCWTYDIYITLCTRVGLCELKYKSGLAVSNLMIYLNSSINPFVYFFLKKDVKRELKACCRLS